MNQDKIIFGFHSITSHIRLDPLSIKEVYIDENEQRIFSKKF